MTLFAKDQEKILSAWDAIKGRGYQCLECSQEMRVRQGSIPHFYHVQQSSSCRLHSKSERHLRIQLALQKDLPGALLEHRFPSIQRIGDVVWKDQIYEVQCSPIQEEEVLARIREYGALGYTVVWIFDEKLIRRHRSITRWIDRYPHFFVGGEKSLYFYQKKKRVSRETPAPSQKNIWMSLRKWYLLGMKKILSYTQ